MRENLQSYIRGIWCGGSCNRSYLPTDTEVLSGVVDLEENGGLTFRVRDADLIALTKLESDETQALLEEKFDLTIETIETQTALLQTEFDQTQTAIGTVNTSIGVTNTRLTTINTSIAATNTALGQLNTKLDPVESTVTLLSATDATPVTVSPGYRALSFTVPAGTVTTVNGATVEGRFELPISFQHSYSTAIVVATDSTTPIVITEIR